MPRLATTLATLATVFALSSGADASLIPTSQERAVEASARILLDPHEEGTDADAATAPDFAAFSETVGALVALGYVASAQASQQSAISPSLVVAGERAEAFASANDFDALVDATGVSGFRLGFELASESL